MTEGVVMDYTEFRSLILFPFCAISYIALFAISMIVASITGPSAFAGSCEGVTDDAEVAACVTQELQSEVERLKLVYAKLSETLGPSAAADMMKEQMQWLDRVAEYCGISQDETLESLTQSQLAISRTLCSKRFVEARTTELIERHNLDTDIN